MGVFKNIFNPDPNIEELKRRIESFETEQLNQLKASVDNIEKQISEEGKRIASPSQQLLILYHLGLLKPIDQLKIEQKQKGKLLAALLNIGAENAEKNIGKIGTGKSPIETERNYEFIIDFFYGVGLKELAQKCESIKMKMKSKKGK